ncbi:MAG: hypothetical protein IJQ41_05965 [Firmicutes bacterium]|jgi:hypothetical protein|nr:hypothetical protein [Bacillota bacterium]MBQ4409353.1 hypothetical protein [Bacillota bacterium]MBQ6294856.1 hypothetical protein [Bacillota bacterium]MBR0051546.1 hypothetical protein [Bacillota bacterium]MBR0210272.1 hypothetical protein [Bacillota bacterium]
MRQIRRIVSLILVFAMLSTGIVFADAAAIVSPAANSIVYTDSLLVSVKVTELKTIRVSVYAERVVSGDKLVNADVSKFTEADLKAAAGSGKYTDVLLGEAATYTNTVEIGFYTKQIAVSPGLYKVKAETLETVMEWPEGATEPVEKIIVTETKSSLVAVKKKPVEEKPQVFQNNSTGAVTFIRKILKGLLK